MPEAEDHWTLAKGQVSAFGGAGIASRGGSLKMEG